MNLARKINDYGYIELTEKVACLVHKISGNKFTDKQYSMIDSRIKRRMLEIKINSPIEYSNYIDTNLESETTVLVNLLTTHHTFFFREFVHFEFLKNDLPRLIAEVEKRGENCINVWSAACSKGQEVYSLAMFLDFYIPKINPKITFKILGTDIDSDSIKIAKNGVYLKEEIKEIPMNFLSDNWSLGTEEIANFAKIKTQLKRFCEFKPENLLNLSLSKEKFDIIFCRNVFIYFEADFIKKITLNLLQKLNQNGVLITGLSESLAHILPELHSLGPSIYSKNKFTLVEKVENSTNIKFNKVIKVLCVDDSNVILNMLKKVLLVEEGFEIVSTAKNGLEAIEYLKNNKVDVITLDIHMPEMDGITYLEKNFKSGHAPVIMLSSADRSESSLSQKALKLGASDFIEKPTLQNLHEKKEELKNKIKSAVENQYKTKQISQFDKEIEMKITHKNFHNKAQFAFFEKNQTLKLKNFLKNFQSSNYPTIIFLEESQSEIAQILLENKKFNTNNLFSITRDKVIQTKFEKNNIYIANLVDTFDLIYEFFKERPSSILVLGMPTLLVKSYILKFKKMNLLIEDLGEVKNNSNILRNIANDIVPVTSFTYLSNNFLNKNE